MAALRHAPLFLAVLALGACGQSGDAPSGETATAAQVVAAPSGTAWADHLETTPEGGVRMGNPDAPIKLIEYGSLSCPVCARLAQDGYERLVEHYVGSGRVSFEFRSMAIHAQDVPLTLLVNCAPREAFFPLVHQIYSNFDAMQAPLGDAAARDRANAALQGPPEQRLAGVSDALGYTSFFAARGITRDAAHACLGNGAAAQIVSDNTERYAAEGVTGTPALRINGRMLDTTQWAALEEALKAAGAR